MEPAPSFEAFAEALGTSYPNLSPQQRVIAQFVLEHPDDLALGTVATVADAAGVQPSALVRFARAMHFSGFSELQQLFRGRLLARAGTYRERISAMRSAGTGHGVLQTMVEVAAGELQALAAGVPDELLVRAARRLCGARRVHVLAQRRAFPVAIYLAYALGQLELRVQLHDGVGGMLGESLRQLERGELLLVTSFKNYSPEVVNAATAARAAGIEVIAITDTALSPLKPVADICLEIGPAMPTAVRSLVAPMCLAQALVVAAGRCLVEPRKTRRSDR